MTISRILTLSFLVARVVSAADVGKDETPDRVSSRLEIHVSDELINRAVVQKMGAY